MGDVPALRTGDRSKGAPDGQARREAAGETAGGAAPDGWARAQLRGVGGDEGHRLRPVLAL